jgi:hypothetical protein
VIDGVAAGGVLSGTYPSPGFAVDMATQAELDAHVNDTADAHDASAVSITDDLEIFSTLNVQAALESLYTNYINAISTNLGDHINDTADAHDASAISVLDTAGDFTATDVEGALAELQADHEADATGLSDHIADTADAHTATAISFSPPSGWVSTNAQGGIIEAWNKSGELLYESRSSNSILLIDDRKKAIAATATFTQTFDDAAELGSGWWVLYRNATTDGSVVTLDPNDNINGAGSLALQSQESCFVLCTGTEFFTIPVQQEHAARHEDGGTDEISIAGLAGTPTELTNHLSDTSAAHAASAISASSTTLMGTGTDVQAVFEELDNSIDTLRTASINYIIDGGGATITTGVKGDLVIDFACVIQSATLLADQSGSIVVNVWKDTYANYPPVVGDKITASAPPTISSATKSQDSTLTGWTTSIAAGDTLRFNVDSVTTIQRVTLVLKVLRTV